MSRWLDAFRRAWVTHCDPDPADILRDLREQRREQEHRDRGAAQGIAARLS